MKSVFIAANLIGGLFFLVCGIVAMFYVTTNALVAIIGIVTVVVAAVCLWLAEETAFGDSGLST
jgi:uncharacterized membrane protein YvlD (DUF360 family)